jgi:hypothetical protein
MKLSCDLCGHILTEIDDTHAVCSHCGIEYGADRLQELRAAMPSPEPVSTAAPAEPAAESKPKKKKSGCLIWFLIIMAVLDLIIGTHGIVAAFCLIILLIVALCTKKK